jgi:phage-related protein
MRDSVFYRFESDRCPVEEFLSSLTGRQRKKVLFILQLIEELDRVPQEYFKKLRGTDDIWEVRVRHSNNIFRLLGFFDRENVVVLNHAFTKKTQKTPRQEIRIAEQRKRDYQRRKQ